MRQCDWEIPSAGRTAQPDLTGSPLHPHPPSKIRVRGGAGSVTLMHWGAPLSGSGG